MRLAALAVALAALLPAAASAQDLSWTPCDRLETGVRIQELCRTCERQGTGWRFYVSRDGTLTQCRRDPQSSSGIYRKPWEDDDAPRRARDPDPVRRAVVPAPAAPRPEKRSYAPTVSSSARPPVTSTASPSGARAASTGSSQPVREAREPRSSASHASVPRRSTEHHHASSPPPRQARSEAENRREAERRRELKKSER